jgi:hypothetical protein
MASALILDFDGVIADTESILINVHYVTSTTGPSPARRESGPAVADDVGLLPTFHAAA